MNTLHAISSVVFVAAIAVAVGCRDPYCRTRQKEARDDLSALNDAQAKFREANGRFARSFDELGFVTPDPNYYDVAIESASADTYSAKALGKGALRGDEWTINQQGNPVVRTNACQ
jgi:hypothetical protein